jgi:hypothetical protein
MLSEVGSLLFLSGMLPVVDKKLPITGGPGGNLSVEHAAVADGASDLFVQLFWRRKW